MSDPKDRNPRTPPPPSADDGKRSGRAGLDERGNSVWEWQLETGVYSRDISTQKLRKLDLGDLSIAETASHQRPAGLDEKDTAKDKEKAKRELPGGGFNPYDNSAAGAAGGNPYDNARNFGKKVQQPASAPPAQRKPMDLKRLEEWMEIKKRLEQQKKDDDDE